MSASAAAAPTRSVGLFSTLVLTALIGILLLSINLFGLSQSVRKPGLEETSPEKLRFVPEQVWSYRQSMAAIDDLAGAEARYELAERANRVVHQSLVHIDWERVDPNEFRQLIPIWENYFLWAVGRFSSLPQFERYHYADYRRSILRGIGICGDASIALSSIMDRYLIPNRIVSFDGHVIVEFQTDAGEWLLMDPDFGVALGTSLDRLEQNEDRVKARYLNAGYSEREVEYLFEAYRSDPVIFEDTFSFMTLRYLFEEMTYLLKWPIPIALILVPVLWMVRSRRQRNS